MRPVREMAAHGTRPWGSGQGISVSLMTEELGVDSNADSSLGRQPSTFIDITVPQGPGLDSTTVNHRRH
jgi:hypothetical protein